MRWCRGSRNALQGCINDAHCMRYLLMTRMGFGDEDIQMLTDDLPYPAGWPTRNNMLYQVPSSCDHSLNGRAQADQPAAWPVQMQRLVDSCMPGDSLVLHFSGHGSQACASASQLAATLSKQLRPRQPAGA